MSLPPVEIPLGAMRFNSDSQKLEYFNGDVWVQVHTFSPNLDGGHRGLIMGGSSYTDTIEYITISTQGNGQDFGNLGTGVMITSGCSSNTRGLCMGGRQSNGVQTNRIEYLTISTLGDGADFGDLVKTNDYGGIGNLGNQTRGMIQGGVNPAHGDADMGVDINYVTIASTGNAVKFGEATTTHTYSPALLSSPTRGIIAGGGNPSINITDYVTIATTGNASDFGDLAYGAQGSAGAASSVIGLCGGGYGGISPGSIDHYIIQKFTIATKGNAIDWGDLTDSRRWACPLSDSIRAVWCGGYAPSSVNTMDYNVFATAGNSVDFGDMTISPASKGGSAGASNGHGGLG